MRSTFVVSLLSGLLCMGLMLSGCSEEPLKCQEHSDCPESPASKCDLDAHRCVHLCSRDEACPTHACRNGRCVLPPNPWKAASCQVTPDFVLGRSGMRVRFDVLVRDADGEPLVPIDGISWVAATEAVTGGGEGTGATFTLATPGEDSAAVEARVGNATCRARVTVLPADVPPGQVRVVVTDELTGRPLPGAVVVAADAQGNTTATAETDLHGAAWVAATGEVSLSAFHERYGYLTLAHYDAEHGTRDVWLPLRRNPLELHGGIRGTFLNVPRSDGVLIGLTGLSLPAMGFGLEERQFGGPSFRTSATIGDKQIPLRIPSNAYLSLSSTAIKSEYASPGVAGVCDEELADTPVPEDAIRAGLCGTRTGWALSGEVPLPRLLSTDFDKELSVPYVLSQNPNVLRRFQSSVIRDVQFRLKPIPGLETGNLKYEDTAHYVPREHDFQQMPLAFHFPVIVPTPPPYKTPLDRIIIVGTADMAGRGATPLGLGSVDIPDMSKPTIAVNMSMAPTHHGLEGSPYRLFITATYKGLPADPLTEEAAYSILLFPLKGLPSEPRMVNIPQGFLPVPEGGFFNFNSYPSEGLQGREFRFLADSRLDDVTLVSVLFRTNGYRHWMVLMDPQHAMAGVRLPVPPSRFEDRSRIIAEGGEAPNSRARLQIQALSTHKADGSVLDLQTLAEAEEANLARLTDSLTALTMSDHGRPKVLWVTPKREPYVVPSVRPQSKLVVSIDDFLISRDPADDGHVMLTFEGGTGCAEHQLHADASRERSRASVEFDLPAGCRGDQVQMTAFLVDSHNVPLSPPVAQTIIVNIN